MSAYDPRKSVLERLKEREKNRDWSTVNKSFTASTYRRWSAESYREKGEKFVPLRKPSPQHLPKLENRPSSADSHYDQDLKRGNLTVIPPVPYAHQHGEVLRGWPTKAKDTRKEQATHPNHHGSDFYPAMPSNYPYPPMAPPHHPSVMYPVPMIPMHAGYAPWFIPPLGYSAINNGLVNGALYSQRPPNQLSMSQAALILQKYTRGWQVRKGPKFAFWRYMCDKKHSRRFVDDLIESFLADEIIPDVLIDVLSGKKFLSVQDPKYKASERVVNDIIYQDVTAFIHEIALAVFYSQGSSSLSRRDPAVRVSADIVNEVVKESATQIIQSIVDEMVRDHMTVIKTGDWLEDFILEAIGPMLPRVVFEALQQSQDDSLINSIIDEVMEPQLRQVIIEAWCDVADVNRSKHVKKVSIYAEDHLLDALFLQHLLSQLTGDNLSLYFNDYTDQLLDGLICGMLTHQYLAVGDEQEATQRNAGVKELHEEIFCDVALDVLMEELTAHLDEDMQDLLERERERNKLDL